MIDLSQLLYIAVFTKCRFRTMELRIPGVLFKMQVPGPLINLMNFWIETLKFLFLPNYGDESYAYQSF